MTLVCQKQSPQREEVWIDRWLRKTKRERESATVTVQKRRRRTITLDEKRKDNLR